MISHVRSSCTAASLVVALVIGCFPSSVVEAQQVQPQQVQPQQGGTPQRGTPQRPAPQTRPAPGTATRLVAGLRSSEQFIADVEYMVVDLAGKRTSWENNIFPNIDIFLIGVATNHPVRFDLLFDAEHGDRVQAIIPIDELNEFLNGNLNPIGIIPRRDRRDRNLYELTGNVYEGWLRYLESPVPYAVMFTSRAALPADMPHPQQRHADLARQGNTAFTQLRNRPEGIEGRKAAFQRVRANVLDGIEKSPDESRDAFELRKAWVEQQMNMLEQWFSESADVNAGVRVNRERRRGESSLLFAAIPETSLARNINRIGEQASHFAAIRAPEDAVLKLRVNFPVDPGRVEGYRRIYDLTRPVMKQRIDEDERPTDEEKGVRRESADLMMDVLIESSELGVVDLFLDVFPAGEAHGVVFGVRAANREKILQIIENLPGGISRWSLEKEVDEVGGVAIHRVSLGENVPRALVDFYGSSGEVFLAVSEDAFWLGGGENGLENLKSRLQTVQEAGEVEADDVLVSLNMRARPILQHTHQLSQEENLEFLDALQNRDGLFQRQREERRAEPDEEIPGRRARSALQDFQWQETAIEAMEGQNDVIDILIRRSEDGVLVGPGISEQGILRAVGALIAKFADENLQ